MADARRFRMGRLDHVHIRVPDRTEAATWYAEHLWVRAGREVRLLGNGLRGWSTSNLRRWRCDDAGIVRSKRWAPDGRSGDWRCVQRRRRDVHLLHSVAAWRDQQSSWSTARPERRDRFRHVLG